MGLWREKYPLLVMVVGFGGTSRCWAGLLQEAAHMPPFTGWGHLQDNGESRRQAGGASPTRGAVGVVGRWVYLVPRRPAHSTARSGCPPKPVSLPLGLLWGGRGFPLTLGVKQDTGEPPLPSSSTGGPQMPCSMRRHWCYIGSVVNHGVQMTFTYITCRQDT